MVGFVVGWILGRFLLVAEVEGGGLVGAAGVCFSSVFCFFQVCGAAGSGSFGMRISLVFGDEVGGVAAAYGSAQVSVSLVVYEIRIGGVLAAFMGSGISRGS